METLVTDTTKLRELLTRKSCTVAGCTDGIIEDDGVFQVVCHSCLGTSLSIEDMAEVAELAPALLSAADRADALEAELAGLTAQYEERTAYTIVHRGQALVCSDAMRGAYSDEHHRANRAEAELAALKASIEAAPVGTTTEWGIKLDDPDAAPAQGQRVRLLSDPQPEGR